MQNFKGEEMEIGKMRQIRFFRGMTLDDIYLLTGRKISQPKLSRVERGISHPSDEEKELISRVLKIPIKEIFPDEESKE